MNNTKHTPGPWFVDGVYIIRGPKRCVVAKLIDSKEPYETKVANGHMLAAAPAMYEALSELVKYLREEVADEALDTWAPVFKAAMALAQAEGR